MEYIEKISKKEYEIQSKLATEKGLIESGKSLLKKQQNDEKREKSRKKVIKFIQKEFSRTDMPKYEELIELIKNLDKYLKFSEDDIIQLKKEYTELSETYEITNTSNDEYANEINELEIKYNLREEYWIERVKKLREKCIDRNGEISKLRIENVENQNIKCSGIKKQFSIYVHETEKHIKYLENIIAFLLYFTLGYLIINIVGFPFCKDIAFFIFGIFDIIIYIIFFPFSILINNK